MSKLTKTIAVVALAVGMIASAPKNASAQYGYWVGGPGISFSFGFGRPYYGPTYYRPYYRPYYYYAPPPPRYYYQPHYYQRDCGYVRTRVWRNHHWVVRRVWRCWY